MTELQTRVELIRGVFPEVFGYSWENFTSNPLGVSGLSDGAQGVQWNAWVDHKTLEAFVGVNLEGKEYDGWPVARVIARELVRPRIFSARDEVSSTDDIQVYVGREVWQAGNRIRVPENVIEGMPVALSALTQETWRFALQVADECLDEIQGSRKKARQWITLQNGRREMREVSPQMQFYVKLTEASTYPPRVRDAMKAERARLNTLYRFLDARASVLG